MTKIFDIEYYELEEVAKLLNKSRTTIYRMRNEGRLPFRKIGKKVLCAKEDILKMIDGN